MKGKIIAAIGIAALVILVSYMVLIPQGVSSGKPMAKVTLTVTDITNGDDFVAELNLGDPTNQLAVTKPVIPLRPLATVSGDQVNLSVASSHVYDIAMSAVFTYTGTHISTYKNATFSVFADKSVGGSQWVMYNDQTLAKVKSRTSGSGGDPVASSLSSWDFVANSTKDIAASPGQAGLDMLSPFVFMGQRTVAGAMNAEVIHGADLNMWNIHLRIAVTGTDEAGTPVTGHVDAGLIIRAHISDTGGSISVTIDSMKAGVEDTTTGNVLTMFPMSATREAWT